MKSWQVNHFFKQIILIKFGSGFLFKTIKFAIINRYFEKMRIETITNQRCTLGEGPVWDVKRNEIYWVDIINGIIHYYSFLDYVHKSYSVNEMIGSYAICKNDNLIIAAKSGIGMLNRENGKIEMLVNPESHLENNRFNDGKCDPSGRFWAGTMAISEEDNAGNLYVFDNNKIERKIENVSISNGMAWSLDHKTFYYIDSPTFEVAAYDFDNATGNISNRQVIITVPKSEGCPDGMTIDNEGMLWIAHWDGWQVTRWNPATGEKLFHIKLPAARITSLTFGGRHLKDLFITSARIGLSNHALMEQPLAGSLFTIRNCGFEGLPAFEYNN